MSKIFSLDSSVFGKVFRQEPSLALIMAMLIIVLLMAFGRKQEEETVMEKIMWAVINHIR